MERARVDDAALSRIVHSVSTHNRITECEAMWRQHRNPQPVVCSMQGSLQQNTPEALLEARRQSAALKAAAMQKTGDSHTATHVIDNQDATGQHLSKRTRKAKEKKEKKERKEKRERRQSSKKRKKDKSEKKAHKRRHDDEEESRKQRKQRRTANEGSSDMEFMTATVGKASRELITKVTDHDASDEDDSSSSACCSERSEEIDRPRMDHPP